VRGFDIGGRDRATEVGKGREISPDRRRVAVVERYMEPRLAGGTTPFSRRYTAI
jgi:hypothetical protein